MLLSNKILADINEYVQPPMAAAFAITMPHFYDRYDLLYFM
jgi:hypothetical protein